MAMVAWRKAFSEKPKQSPERRPNIAPESGFSPVAPRGQVRAARPPEVIATPIQATTVN
jgi:hypothetical protein